MKIAKLYNIIQSSSCYIKVYDKYGEVCSGSGTLVKFRDKDLENKIYVLTAAHVLNNGSSFKDSEITEYKFEISFPFIKEEYKKIIISHEAISIVDNIPMYNNVNEKILHIPIDIAMFEVKITEIPLKIKPVYMSFKIPRLGEISYCAGFPSDVETSIQEEYFTKSYKNWYWNLRQLQLPNIMIKETKICSMDDIIKDKGLSSESHIYVLYFDKPMFYGASGGGVFNIRGELVGLIQKVGFINQNIEQGNGIVQIPISTSTTIGISSRTIKDFLIKK